MVRHYPKRYERSSSGSHYKPRSIRVFEQKTKRKIIWTIIISLVLLYLLIFWILPAIITNFSKLHKSSASRSTPISEDATLAPPVLNIPFDATNSASIDISGYASPNSKIEVYVDDTLEKETTTAPDGTFQIFGLPLNLGTDSIYAKTISSDNKSSLPSKPIRILYSDQKPNLEVNQPEDNKTIQGGDRKITIAGQTAPENTLTINGSVIILSGDGHFSVQKELSDGDNLYTITATNQVGNSIQIEKKVTFQP